MLLSVSGGAAILAAAAVGLTAGALHGTAEPSAAPPSRRSPSPSSSPSPPPRTLEFQFSGHVTLTSVTYTVSGRSTARTNVRLPWHTTVSIPPLPEHADWDVRYHFSPGEVTLRVLVDGFVRSTTVTGDSGPGSGHDHGTA